jgi:hypothetical protein
MGKTKASRRASRLTGPGDRRVGAQFRAHSLITTAASVPFAHDVADGDRDEVARQLDDFVLCAAHIGVQPAGLVMRAQHEAGELRDGAGHQRLSQPRVAPLGLVGDTLLRSAGVTRAPTMLRNRPWLKCCRD